MTRARDIQPGDTIFIGDVGVERATKELYEACWGDSLPKGKVAFYSLIPNGDTFELEWYLIPGNERTIEQR